MCFDHDSRPPIPPIAGGSLVSGLVTLTASDGAAPLAFHARAEAASGAGVVILPDVRGLHPYYRDLALRFAEHGIDAVAVDYFARTADDPYRGPGFEFLPHVERTTVDTVHADAAAAATFLRSAEGGAPTAVFAIGFCFGGRHAFLASGWADLDLAGVIGFYGQLGEQSRNGSPSPIDMARTFRAPVLGIFGGADEGIPAHAIADFDASLETAGVPHELTTYEGAPHSFFDRKADEFVRSSEEAWAKVLEFIRAHTPAGAAA